MPTHRKPDPARIGSILGMPASTVLRVPVRHGLNRLASPTDPHGITVERVLTDNGFCSTAPCSTNGLAGGPT
ncbi:hypothetical protein ACFWDI_31100 [Streptomyces sp. NPDC060064]|uniref:hypothetical protein n=1 Tax=Streptomyces sp. NPDC060064 TaxID=3347049 RepID=UPI0036B2D86E